MEKSGSKLFIIMNNLNRFILFSIAIVMSICGSVSAREFRALSTNDGLSDLVVNCIYKDSIGYIWLGTGSALDRFDGTRVRSFWIPGDNAMLKRVNSITETSDGSILIGNGNGLYILERNAVSLAPFASDKINFKVNALLQKDGRIYAATQRGLFIIGESGAPVEHIMPHSDIMSESNTIEDIKADSSGNIWMSSAEGLLLYNEGSLRHFHLDTDSNSIKKIMPVGDRIYMSAKNGDILELDPSTGKFYVRHHLDNTLISSLSTDGNDILYIGTDGGGVTAYSTKSGKIVEHLTHDSRLIRAGDLRSNSVYSILIDDKGLLWVGYYQAGLDYTPTRRDIFDVYGYSSFDSEEKTVRAIAIDGEEKLIGTREGLYYINEATHQSAYFCSPTIRANMIFAIKKHKDRYYIGTFNGGMYVFDPLTLQMDEFDPDNEAFKNEAIFSIVTDKDDNMWIGTSKGLFRYADGRQTAHYTDNNSRLPHGNVYEIYFDSAGRGWICTDSGICIWDGSNLRDDGFPKGFPNKEKIRDVYETSDHTLYFVPDKGKIFSTNLPLTEFGYPDIFGEGDNPSASFIIEDSEHNLWIGLSSGLVCYNPASRSYIFSDVDGLPGTIFTLCPPVIDDNGDIWFGNSRGLVHLDYAKFQSSDYEYGKTVISEVLANGKLKAIKASANTTDIQEVTIRGGETPVSFQFADLSFIEPYYQLYEYMLDGVDSDWRILSGKSEVTYFNLPGGHYRMMLRYAGDNESETVMNVIVKNRINWIEIMLGTLLILSICSALYLYIQHRRHSRATTADRNDTAEPSDIHKPHATNSDHQEKYRTTRLSDKECRTLNKKLEELMKIKKPYINADLKIADLAVQLSTSAHTLSFLFNQYLKKNYYDYINEYRVAEFKQMVDAGETSRYTLTAMSERCGFSSRASFFRHFKKFTGITPSEYIKNRQK